MSGFSLGLSRFIAGRLAGNGGRPPVVVDPSGKIYMISGLKPLSGAVLYFDNAQVATANADTAGVAVLTVSDKPAAGVDIRYDAVVSGTVSNPSGSTPPPTFSIFYTTQINPGFY
jgi:hypothetical protein